MMWTSSENKFMILLQLHFFTMYIFEKPDLYVDLFS